MAGELEMSGRKVVKLSANKHKLGNKAFVKALMKTDRKQSTDSSRTRYRSETWSNKDSRVFKGSGITAYRWVSLLFT